MKRIALERTYNAPLRNVWDLWTTRAGFESWWGPGGFEAKVLALDLQPGGKLLYNMTATGPQQIAFMERAGMPLATQAEMTFTEIEPMRRLGYTTRADFIPGVKPYDVRALIEFHASKGAVRMVVTMDAMHDDVWTQRSVQGMESQLEKLVKIFK